MSVDYSQGSAAPPTPPTKKGMGPLGWIAIGCGVIIVFCLIALVVGGFFIKRAAEHVAKNPGKFVAEMIVRTNPDLEIVNQDESAGTITVKNKKTGETSTVNLEDAKNGKLSFKSDKGTVTIDGNSKDGGVIKVTDDKGHESVMSAGGGAPKNLPSWVPNYPGATSQGTFDTNNDKEHAGAFTVSTKDPVSQVIGWYESQLKSAGLKVEKTTYNANGKDGGTVTGKSDDDKRTVSIGVSTDDNGTSAIVTFNDKH
jgi:archaellum component FlaG (FlaF/FlaG flagellin family)